MIEGIIPFIGLVGFASGAISVYLMYQTIEKSMSSSESKDIDVNELISIIQQKDKLIENQKKLIENYQEQVNQYKGIAETLGVKFTERR